MTGWLVDWSPRLLCNVIYGVLTEGVPPAAVAEFDELLCEPVTAQDAARLATGLAYVKGVLNGEFPAG